MISVWVTYIGFIFVCFLLQCPILLDVRIIVAKCSVSYQGRGDTVLPAAVRMVMLKRDGSVSIHADDRAFKPLNWMLTPCEFSQHTSEEETLVWVFESKKDRLEIHLLEVYSDTEHELEPLEPGLSRKWTESDLQAWIAANPEEAFGEGWSVVGREFPTGAGPVDLLMRDPDGFPVAVEVKRVASMPAVDQVLRYVNALQDTEDFKDARPVIAAFDIRPRTVLLAEKRGVVCHILKPERDTHSS